MDGFLKDKIIEEYKFEKLLGKGAFAQVWKASRAGKEYAVKCLPADDSTAEMEEDIANRVRFTTPFLVKYYKSFKCDGSLFIVMELCDQGDLEGLIKNCIKEELVISNQRVMKIFIQMALGIAEMHSFNMFHRDIKAQNTFINKNYEVKIGDFGIAKRFDSSSVMTVHAAGTPNYMAPEIFEGKPYNNKADIWSLGVLLYYLCALELPFNAPNVFMLPEVVKKGKYKPLPKYVDEDVAKAVDSMLTLDPTSRPSALDLLRLPLVQAYAQKLELSKFFPALALGVVPESCTKDGFSREEFGGELNSDVLAILISSGLKKKDVYADPDVFGYLLKLTSEYTFNSKLPQDKANTFAKMVEGLVNKQKARAQGKRSGGGGGPPSQKKPPHREGGPPPPIPSGRGRPGNSPPPLPPRRPGGGGGCDIPPPPPPVGGGGDMHPRPPLMGVPSSETAAKK